MGSSMSTEEAAEAQRAGALPVGDSPLGNPGDEAQVISPSQLATGGKKDVVDGSEPGDVPADGASKSTWVPSPDAQPFVPTGADGVYGYWPAAAVAIEDEAACTGMLTPDVASYSTYDAGAGDGMSDVAISSPEWFGCGALEAGEAAAFTQSYAETAGWDLDATLAALMTEEQKASKLARKANYKTQPCWHFQRGRCNLGSKCNFAHGVVDVPVLPVVEDDPLVESMKTESPRTAILTLCQAWGALSNVKPLSRGELLKLRPAAGSSHAESYLKCLPWDRETGVVGVVA